MFLFKNQNKDDYIKNGEKKKILRRIYENV